LCLYFGFIKPKYAEQGTSLSTNIRDATGLTEAVVVICPNPKCRREIEEPILLTVLSVTPPKQYEACPYCFAKLELEPEPTVEQNDVPEPTIEEEETIVLEEKDEIEDNLSTTNGVLEKVKVSAPDFLKKVKALLPTSNGNKKGTEEQIEEEAELAVKKETVPEEETEDEAFELIDEPEELTEPESSDEEETAKEESKPEESPKKETAPSGCPETFGYLSNRPSDAPIPPQCLLCPRIVDCMLQPKE
jgi:hypothetical protein